MIIKQEKEHLEVQRPSDSKTYRSLHGTTRALLSNMVHGVSDGFSKDLEIIGIGFSAVMEESDSNWPWDTLTTSILNRRKRLR